MDCWKQKIYEVLAACKANFFISVCARKKSAALACLQRPFVTPLIHLLFHYFYMLLIPSPLVSMLSEIKKKRLEDPKFISSMQKGAILRKCVNTFVPHCS